VETLYARPRPRARSEPNRRNGSDAVLTAAVRNVGVVAVALPPAACRIQRLGDFLFQLAVMVGLLAGVVMWHAVNYRRPVYSLESVSGRIILSVGLWTIAAEPIIRAVVMRNLYGTDFFIQ